MLKKLYDKGQALPAASFIILTFVLISLVGGFLLSLPVSSNSGSATPFIDAWFTAVSAVCVTGQITLNTMEHWNYFGRTVIITLIEVGGLGFMTLWVTVFLFLGRRIDLKSHKVLLEALNISDISQIRSLLYYILRFSFTIQGIGAFLLGLDFIPRLGWAKGIYYAVFHSISAFCNAGFDLFGNSMIDFQDNPLVLLTIAGLIVVGGLGFIVWRDLLTYYKNRQLLWHTKIVVSVTTILIIGGTLLFIITEHQSGLFNQQPFLVRLTNYLFLSVTPRTAGYANIDYQWLTPAGIFVTLILMFIGASSGSTGGGIKTTTLATVLIQASSGIKRRGPEIFNRTIPQEAITKSIYIMTSGLVVITISTFILLVTETIPAGYGIEYILIDVISCFSTVGLTMGLTPHLTFIGKVVLIALMLIGRIGLLTVFWSSTINRKPSKITLPAGRLMIG